MSKFIISTDSCADLFKSDLARLDVHCIIMKRVQNGREIGDLFDSEQEVDAFYEEIKHGALPTTIALNPFEIKEYFKGILKQKPAGDLIHLTLSSGLSSTYENARLVAEELNETLSGRKIYVIDSLIATGGMAFLVQELTKMRDKGLTADAAVSETENIRAHLQSWIIVDNLKHLHRGGRVSKFSAAVGTMLNIKPIIVLSKTGHLAIENKIRTFQKSIAYIVGKMEKYGLGSDFSGQEVWIYQTSRNENTEVLKKAVRDKYPNANISIRRVGTVIGTHLGDGTVAMLFQGAPRLDIR